jgi:hypothetical protein
LDFHAQLSAQNFYDGLGVLHHLLGVFKRRETDTQDFSGFAGVAASDQP